MNVSYEDLNITTQTYIISTDLRLRNDLLFDRLVCGELREPLAKQKKMTLRGTNLEIPDDTVLFCEYKGMSKGTPLKKLNKGTKTFMLNCITLIVKKMDRCYNIKVSDKGNIQVTGCTGPHCPKLVLETFWNLLVLYEVPPTSVVNAYIYPVMCNVSFDIGFQVFRERLSTIVNQLTEFVSILEPSDGYVGVNVKICVKDEPMDQVMISRYQYSEGVWTDCPVPYGDYLDTLPQKDKDKKMINGYGNSFLIFYSGRIIMSGGVSFLNRKRAYELFLSILNKHRATIEICSSTSSACQTIGICSSTSSASTSSS